MQDLLCCKTRWKNSIFVSIILKQWSSSSSYYTLAYELLSTIHISYTFWKWKWMPQFTLFITVYTLQHITTFSSSVAMSYLPFCTYISASNSQHRSRYSASSKFHTALDNRFSWFLARGVCRLIEKSNWIIMIDWKLSSIMQNSVNNNSNFALFFSQNILFINSIPYMCYEAF